MRAGKLDFEKRNFEQLWVIFINVGLTLGLTYPAGVGMQLRRERFCGAERNQSRRGLSGHLRLRFPGL